MVIGWKMGGKWRKMADGGRQVGLIFPERRKGRWNSSLLISRGVDWQVGA